MNSVERKQKRYEKRKAKREEKKQQSIQDICDMSIMTNMNKLNEAFRLCKLGVLWKESTQRYYLNCLKNMHAASNSISKNEMVKRIRHAFHLIDRGKHRTIVSVGIAERVIQKNFVINILLPSIRPHLIMDNSACLKKKGISFAKKRLDKHIRDFYNHYGNNGFVLKIDIKDYFASIPHKTLKEEILDKYLSKEYSNFAYQFIEDKHKNIGLALGSEINQILAVSYLNKIDHFIKDQLAIKYYARYMDDSYIIHHDKRYLMQCLEAIKAEYAKLGLKLNMKKTQVCEIDKSFVFLKTHYRLTETGKIIKRPHRKYVYAWKRKLMKLHKFHNNGKISLEYIQLAQKSWINNMSSTNSYYIRKNMNKYYRTLFNDNTIKWR